MESERKLWNPTLSSVVKTEEYTKRDKGVERCTPTKDVLINPLETGRYVEISKVRAAIDFQMGC